MPLWLLGLIKSPLTKWIAGGIVVCLALWFAIHQFNNYKAGLIEQGRQTGRAEMTKQFRDQVAENNRVNRQVEQRIDSAITAYGDRIQESLDRMRGQSSKIAGQVINSIDARPEIFRNTSCDTPQDTIDARNSIRALGPPAKQ